MQRMRAVSPIVSAFLCGWFLPQLLEAVETGAGVHSATDLLPWLVVPLAGLDALWGVWRALRPPRPAPSA